jgi:pimeloyl-ACP methyl ester carboxylesterase
MRPFLHTVIAAALCFVSFVSSCASAPRSGSGRVLAPDTVEIAYDVRGQGEPAIVLIHCWCGNRAFWKDQVDELARDHRVVQLDLPGHGASGRNRAHWTVTGFAPDVQAVADKLGLKRMILVGHSMGGPVALAAAGRMSGRVLGVIGVDNLQDADHPMPREFAETFAKALEADFEAGMANAIGQMLGGAHPELAAWLTAEAVKADHTAAIALMRDFPNVDLRALFRGAGVPIRNINSANPKYPTNVAVNRKYADFTAQLMPGVAHFPQLEQPAEFNPRLRATIEELEGAAKQ